jgi:hypothetical protein
MLSTINRPEGICWPFPSIVELEFQYALIVGATLHEAAALPRDVTATSA